MKILLDENLPRKLKFRLGADHELFTVREMNWLGKHNGELLGLMTLHGFDGFVTIDKNLRYQQKLSRFPIRLFILNAPNNRLDTLEPYIKTLSETLDDAITEQIRVVDID